MKSFIAFLILSLVSINSFAAGAVANLTITEVWVGGYADNGHQVIRLRLASQHANPDSCQNPSWITINKANTAIFKEQYTLATLAVATGMKVSAWLSGCTSDGRYAQAARLTVTAN